MKWMIGLVLAAATATASAERGRLAVPVSSTWQQECGSCHIAYPPQLLKKENWRQLMAGLDKHFGTDASLDAEGHQEISAFLQRYAARSERYDAASLRISDTQWFKREHREISGRTWGDPAVKSRSNCTACHLNAERGDWSERGIRVPGGAYRDDDD